MFIKKIIIQGFKTYKNTTVIDLLSPRHNVVVGRNGSGKSNFFAAIRFVLSDAYTHMNREERQGLIHEGSGTVMSAYVEIVFDNSDGRFPIHKEEISIRRTIGLKKDDYSMDGRSVTRSDIMNILESAGFSKSNPYYIVPQGRITALTNSKDSERMILLKEVSGATVFENKLKESTKEMNTADNKKQRIDETLRSVDDRLSDLQVESADLKKFQALEKTKKSLEFNLFDRELNNINIQIDDISEKYGQMLLDSQRDLEELETREKLCSQLTESINDLKVSVKIATLDKEQTESDYNSLFKIVSEKEVRLNEITNRILNDKERTTEINSSIQHYRSLIETHEGLVSNQKPELKVLQRRETEAKTLLSRLIASQRSLYVKQSRFSKFGSKEERDNWLSKELETTQQAVMAKETALKNVRSEISEKQSELDEINMRIKNLNELILNPKSFEAVKATQDIINQLKIKSAKLNDQRRLLWRDEIKFRSVLDSIQHDLSNADFLVSQTMDRAQSRGLEAVKRIAMKLNLQDKVYGSLIELFTVSEKYKTAVEVTANNSLFHVVVDSDYTAGLIMEELVRTKGGRVTFMPLNRLKSEDVVYPDSSQFQSIPLIKKIKFEDFKIEKAVKQVFGKTIVCADLQEGSELARSYKLSAITIDGDRADTKGVLSGGFRDYKRSRIDAVKSQVKKRNDIKQVKLKLDHSIEEIERINQELTVTNNELAGKTFENENLLNSLEPLKIEKTQLEGKKFDCEQKLINAKSIETRLIQSKEKLNTLCKEFRNEKDLPFTDSLSDEDIELLSSLKSKIIKQETELDTVVTMLSDMESNISNFESELNDNYRPHLEKLLEEKASASMELISVECEDLQTEIERLKVQLENLQTKSQNAVIEFERINNEIASSEVTLRKANEQQLRMVNKIEKHSKHSEKTLNKKGILVARRDELQKSIRELGVLPEQAFQHSNYDGQSSDELLQQLSGVNGELLKYSHINKKALEQFNTFTRQRDDLFERRNELERSRESIEALMQNLESQKDAAITKSFNQVAKSFHEIFGELVPQGVGQLIMQKRENEHQHQGEEIESTIKDYIGVSISVSFNSHNDEQQRIEQLSGGQKSLCAIALILAIQKCDPAPFYLFDEIDANLDTQYRSAVASMIKSLSSSAQFICTTFRPEMLQVADKFYGVTFSNKVSTVSEINKDEAMSFVEGQQAR